MKYAISQGHTRKSFVSTHFVTILGAFVSGFITMPSNYVLLTDYRPYWNDVGAITQLLHNLDFSKPEKTHGSFTSGSSSCEQA